MVSHFAEWVDEAARPRASTSPRPASATRLRDAGGRPVDARSGSGRCSTCSSTARCTARMSSRARSRRCAAIAAHADIVILTNIGDEYRGRPVEQLEAVRHPPPGAVQPRRQGPAGAGADRGDEAERRPSSSTISPVHHESVPKHAPAGLAPAHDRRAAPRRAHAARPSRPCPDRRLGRGGALDPGAAEGRPDPKRSTR